ncbi:thioredoxin domain-containing protein [Olivibacter sitiensis]|uniref:thioredoxin domain-containing protein n=1 Tax=Olivibacter sitiensis TaxID=376470 RepID=UPI0004180377|nr:thioredoxin domain-containing protein [Olivibacter sitiensis]
MSNELSKESSPYLLQHQHNPVHWKPWGQKVLQGAQEANKLIIVSIGYSACHWCHVMERESFEDEEVAALMNAHFVSIKVDREERPDVDQVYMAAVQLMTDSGGWPLNCICLPDGRPIYGGTYFRKADWMNILQQLATMWQQRPEVAYDYAERLMDGMAQSDTLPISSIPERYTRADLEAIVEPWKKHFDKEEGGYKRAPKFPLPNNWLFLLRYGVLLADEEVLDHVHFTLRKMAFGGIYDQIGGGFARYSVDAAWHVPHFEKMLYDNAQLVSLYAEAYQQNKDPLYKRVVSETLAWAKREMRNSEGGFYCALDADSEGVEGKFYTFDAHEFDEVLGDDAPLFKHYFSVTDDGNWAEEEVNVLKVMWNADSLADEAGFGAQEWEDYLSRTKNKLLSYRNQRVRPGLDNKLLTSWNAMMAKAFVDAYRVFGIEEYLDIAKQNAAFIEKYLVDSNGKLLHQPTYNTSIIRAFHDDYAFVIELFIALYEATFEPKWLYKAREWAEESIEEFYDGERGVFYYTSASSEQLIARKAELLDNVIPASNSIMARQLHKLGLFFDENEYINIADQLLANMVPQMKSYGSAYSNWCIRLMEEVVGFNEIAITGPHAMEHRIALDTYYIPHKLVLGGQEENLPLLQGRITERDAFYICRNKTCSLPVQNIDEALKRFF